MPKTIVSYNVNGIRAALNKGLLDWVKANDIDIFCVQETKAQPEQVDARSEFEALGYEQHWHSAEKKGYSGVATFSRIEPDDVVVGCGMEQYDREGRILRTDYGDWSVLNCYFPSGTTGDIRQGFKMEFLADFHSWVKELRKERPKLIIVGDYNIAHTEIDIHDPVGNKKSSGFLPEEREWMSQWFDNGFVDAFRHLNPDKVEYSWWTYRAGARKKNKGWRIDYQSVTENLKDKLLEAYQMTDVVHSDHCPVYMKIAL
ncbi:MAG: exodeoxyribonuclease III [Phaeodactylibacter sp.]|nr:exodeoxyribonuclease III [Phaeodactylibacter sp.]